MQPAATPRSDLDQTCGRLWQAEELGQILAHQLAAPLQMDLERVAPDASSAIERASAGLMPAIRSFGDLLYHPQPPAELLHLVRDFALRSLRDPRHPLPKEIARVLYAARGASGVDPRFIKPLQEALPRKIQAAESGQSPPVAPLPGE